MDGIQISVATAGAKQDIYVVKIAGYIDTTTSSELERVIQSLLREQHYKIIIDLQNVDYISSAGWGIFISEIKNIRTHRGDLKLVSMSETVNEVYELLEFSTILTSASNVEEAVRLFGDDSDTTSPAAGFSKSDSQPVVSSPQPVSVSSSPQKPGSIASRMATQAKSMKGRSSAETASTRARSSSQPVSMSSKSPFKVTPAAAPAPAESSVSQPPRFLPLIDRIRALLKAHPDWGAWKLKNELNRRRGTQPKVSWSEVRAELKYNNLASKKDRFKFARGYKQ